MVKASLQQYTKFLFGCYLNGISVRCFQLYNNFKVFADYNYHQLGVLWLDIEWQSIQIAMNKSIIVQKLWKFVMPWLTVVQRKRF